jgi:hypothetical protein
LLAQSHHSGQNAFDKQAAIFTLRPITTATPNDTPAQRPFGGIIGGLNSFAIDKSPQSLLGLKNILAGAAGLAVSQHRTNIQQADDLITNWLHYGLEIDPGKCSGTYAMPEAKDLFETGQQHPSNHRRFSPALHPSPKIRLRCA